MALNRKLLGRPGPMHDDQFVPRRHRQRAGIAGVGMEIVDDGAGPSQEWCEGPGRIA